MTLEENEISDEFLTDDVDEASAEEIAKVQGEALEGLKEKQKSDSWQLAAELVERFRPVPNVLWTAIRSVYKDPIKIGEGNLGAFGSFKRLLVRASEDPTLVSSEERKVEEKNQKLTSALLASLGDDVAATCCFIYSICRRVESKLPERVWRPIVDDALLRAQIGFYVGSVDPQFGPGRGMLAGFSGRCGLAIQIASGSVEQSKEMLESIALGSSVHDIGMKIFGCGPLQVSAMCLAAAGISTDAAFGTASFAVQNSNVSPGNREYVWLASFSVIERLRMGHPNMIEEAHWGALNMLEEQKREELKKKAKTLLRRGHKWKWFYQTEIV